MKKIINEAFERERRKKLNEPNKESVVRDIVTIVCASAMIPFAIALICKGEYECALLGLILARLMLMERKNESSE